MALYTHLSTFPVYHGIDTTQIYITSQLVTKRTGMMIQPNKAIVGANAFAHESGIHQDGVLKHKETYEIMQPEVVGIPSNSLVLGKHSGRNAFKSRLESLITASSVYDVATLANAETMERLFTSFKKLADTKKKGVTDQDLFALIDDELHVSGFQERFTFKSLQVMSGTDLKATATVSVIDTTCSSPDGSSDSPDILDAAIGHGPVHAIFSAINRIVGIKSTLASYDVQAVTEGSDSLGRVTVRIMEDALSTSTSQVNLVIGDGFGSHKAFDSQSVYQGSGTDEDILVASAKAYIQAINRLLVCKVERPRLQPVAVPV